MMASDNTRQRSRSPKRANGRVRVGWPRDSVPEGFIELPLKGLLSCFKPTSCIRVAAGIEEEFDGAPDLSPYLNQPNIRPIAALAFLRFATGESSSLPISWIPDAVAAWDYFDAEEKVLERILKMILGSPS